MKLMRYAGVAAATASLTLAMAGAAMASDVVVDTTGPDSNQTVVISNSTDVSVTNVNEVEVNNVSVQNASTGDVTAAKNTSVGGSLESGDATNTAATSTAVVIGNAPVGGAGNAEQPTVPAGGNGGNQVGGQPAGGSGGSVLGASAGGLGAGAATLPEVGASVPVDVSALRAAWQPSVEAPTASLVKQTRGVTTAMLVTAALLSLLGAIGTAVYARRKQGRI